MSMLKKSTTQTQLTKNMKTKLTNGDTIETYTDETGTYSARWQIGDKTGDCYQKGDEVTNEVEA
jgi:hypothetical protein